MKHDQVLASLSLVSPPTSISAEHYSKRAPKSGPLFQTTDTCLKPVNAFECIRTTDTQILKRTSRNIVGMLDRHFITQISTCQTNLPTIIVC